MALFTYFQLTDAVLPQLNSLLLVVVPVSSMYSGYSIPSYPSGYGELQGCERSLL